MQSIGRISSVHRYPVKSMGGERLGSASLTLQGILGDRWHAFVQSESKGPFPWLTARETARMLLYSAKFLLDGGPHVEVATPGGKSFAGDSPELLDELQALAARPIYRLTDYRGSFDVAPASLMAHSTAAAIAAASETPEDRFRFRMNFYIDTGSAEPFPENTWVGRVLRLGETARVAVTEPDKRCVMINLEHQSSGASPRVLRAAGELNGANVGVYAAVVTPGEVHEGDEVWIE
jgi:uncharacterized protein YcbX